MNRWFFLICLGLFSTICFSQQFDTKISASTLEWDGQSSAGLETFFDFNEDRVEKGLWQFSHSFAKTTNFRTHFEVSIPLSGSNQSIALLAQVVNLNGRSCLFKLTMKPPESQEKYRAQLKDFILQFKQHFYVAHYQEEIELLEARAAGEADNYLRSIDKPGNLSAEHFKTIQDIHREIESLRDQQRQILAIR